MRSRPSSPSMQEISAAAKSATFSQLQPALHTCFVAPETVAKECTPTHYQPLPPRSCKKSKPYNWIAAYTVQAYPFKLRHNDVIVLGFPLFRCGFSARSDWSEAREGTVPRIYFEWNLLTLHLRSLSWGFSQEKVLFLKVFIKLLVAVKGE